LCSVLIRDVLVGVMEATSALGLSESSVIPTVAPPFQVEEGPAGAALFHAMSFTLWRVGLAPVALSDGERAELQWAVRQTRAALAALDLRTAGRAMPAGYERGLAEAALALNQMLAKSTVTRADFARVKIVAQDTLAKQRWAEQNPAAPFGPLAIELRTDHGEFHSNGCADILFRTRLDDATNAVPPISVGRGTRILTLWPGSYVFWQQGRGGRERDDSRHEFVADGSTTIVNCG
jgi:hypothetical protein